MQTLGFPYSISAEFLQRNQHQTLEESLEAFESIVSLGQNAGLDVAAYVSMAFGNPYGEPWNVDEVVTACELLIDAGATEISLADTVGLATPGTNGCRDAACGVCGARWRRDRCASARPAGSGGLAGHSRAAFDAGCRRFDGAIGGLGGCPFAQDALVGNIPTETLLAVLRERGAVVPKIGPMAPLLAANAEIAGKFSTPVQ